MAIPAAAHTALIDSDPADGATVVELDSVTLEFSGDLLEIGTVLTLTHDSGESFQLDDAVAAGTLVTASVGEVPGGAYTLDWRVVAEDGHPIEGQYSFTFEPPAPGPEPEASATTPAPEPASSTPSPVAQPEVSPTAQDEPQPEPGELDDSSISTVVAVGAALGAAALVTVAWMLVTRRRVARED